MVPNISQIRLQYNRTTSAVLNKELKCISKEKQKNFKEITRDLLDRQNEYDKLNKVYSSGNLNHNGNFQKKQSKFYIFKRAAREAKLKFFQKSSCNGNNQKNHNLHSLQQKHSIEIIAQIFRNQRSISSFRSPHKKQIKNNWNLQLILIITIPIICLLVIIQELIGLKE